MKKHAARLIWILIFFLIFPVLFGCQENGESPREEGPVLQEKNEKIAYSIGMGIGKDLLNKDLDLNIDTLRQGIRDGLKGNEPLMSEEEIEQIRQAFIEERQDALNALAKKNLMEGEAFLAENAEKEGITILPRGLQYRVLAPGDGARPTADDNVKVHYKGYLIDGTEFENTYAKEQPAVFPVWSVIPAWQEALPLMREGAQWELFVPPDLAYGREGAGKAIGPNQALIFKLELLGIH